MLFRSLSPSLFLSLRLLLLFLGAASPGPPASTLTGRCVLPAPAGLLPTQPSFVAVVSLRVSSRCPECSPASTWGRPLAEGLGGPHGPSAFLAMTRLRTGRFLPPQQGRSGSHRRALRPPVDGFAVKRPRLLWPLWVWTPPPPGPVKTLEANFRSTEWVPAVGTRSLVWTHQRPAWAQAAEVLTFQVSPRVGCGRRSEAGTVAPRDWRQFCCFVVSSE